MSLIPYQITTTQWLSLEPPIRQKLIEVFKIPRSQGTTVVDNIVVSDGHTHDDLANISLEAMNKYLGSKSSDYFTTLNKVIEHIVSEAEDENVRKIEAQQEARIKEVEEHNRIILENVSKLLLTVNPTAPVEKAAAKPKK